MRSSQAWCHVWSAQHMLEWAQRPIYKTDCLDVLLSLFSYLYTFNDLQYEGSTNSRPPLPPQPILPPRFTSTIPSLTTNDSILALRPLVRRDVAVGMPDHLRRSPEGRNSGSHLQEFTKGIPHRAGIGTRIAGISSHAQNVHARMAGTSGTNATLHAFK
jgi:hypothetical protein